MTEETKTATILPFPPPKRWPPEMIARKAYSEMDQFKRLVMFGQRADGAEVLMCSDGCGRPFLAQGAAYLIKRASEVPK
jgi:hypothetical protein